MDQELKLMLESIKGELESVKSEMRSMKDNQETFAREINVRFDGVDGKLEGSKSQLDRIEAETNDDVVTLLESINGKIEALATKEDVEYWQDG
ncbi:hypothetical protein ACF3MZ_16410 [Paenibacillaceae bacterium WGS1546]|uniref:hypothetical protein n=1 Tax=Cohnella sp. WGS1546 TaxID=3366810 RepID=UPI00372D26C6